MSRLAWNACVTWPNRSPKASDLTKVEGDREKLFKAFSTTQLQIANRIRLFMGLPIEKIDRMSLQTKLRVLGQQRDV